MRTLGIYKKIFLLLIFIVFAIVSYFWSNYVLTNKLLVQEDNDNFLRWNFRKKITALTVKNKLCHVEVNDSRTNVMHDNEELLPIYYVTPTYPRPEQIPELTRLCHTLMHVPKIHWIVADDTTTCSGEVFSVLKKSGLPYTHISSPKPFKYVGTIYPRGVSNRLAALNWLRDNVKKGILYFGDDDNTVDLQLFQEIRKTKKLSMFPVGLIGGYGISSPIVHNGKVVAFFDSWPGDRTFPVDMAGFAVNMDILSENVSMPYQAGYEEDKFLQDLGVNIEDIEPLAENCTKVLVWHTRTFKYKKPSLKINLDTLKEIPEFNSFARLLKEVTSLGMAGVNTLIGTEPVVTFPQKVYEALPNHI